MRTLGGTMSVAKQQPQRRSSGYGCGLILVRGSLVVVALVWMAVKAIIRATLRAAPHQAARSPVLLLCVVCLLVTAAVVWHLYGRSRMRQRRHAHLGREDGAPTNT